MQSLYPDDYVLKVNFKSCPVQATLGVLGHKWALIVLRNIGLYHKQRFNEMLKITPGLTKRVLSMRLKELENEKFIEIIDKGQNFTKWELTEKGKDALAILMVMVQFGSKYYADQVFEDRKPRNLDEVFDESYIQETMSKLFTDKNNYSDTFAHTSLNIPQENKAS